MSNTYHTAQGDRYTVARQLTTQNQPVDLTGRDVTFVARHESGDKIVDALAEIHSPETGRVSYQMSPTETAVAGEYDLEWIVSGGASDPTTFPVEAPGRLIVREDVEKDDATADPLPEDRTVSTLYAEEFNGGVTADQPVTTLAGANLSISNGALDAADSDTQRTDEEIEDVVAALLAAGSNVSLGYDDANDTLTVSATDTTRTDEEIEDVVGALLAAGSNVSLSYDDANDVLTVSATDTQLSDADVRDAINTDSDHGSTAPHNYFSGSHDDLTNVSEADHRTDSNVRQTIDGDGIDRTIWVIANGASDPAGADSNDIIFEEEA